MSATNVPELTEAERLSLIAQVTYSAEPLLHVLLAHAQSDKADSDTSCLLLGLIPRLQQLNDAVMGAAGGGEEGVRDAFRQAGFLVPEVQS